MRRTDSTATQQGAKYQFRNGRFRAARQLGPSIILADLVAESYEEHLPGVPLGHLLDLGCGTAPLRPLYRSAERVVYADIERRDGSLEPFVGLDAGRGLPLRSASFDTVVMSDVLEHLAQPQQAISEVARVLRPGGRLLGNTPYLYWLHEEPHDYWRPSGFALAHVLVEAGMSDVEVHPLGGSVEVVADVAAKHLAALGGIGHPIGGLVGGAGSAWARSRQGRRLMRTTGLKYPMGHFFVARRPLPG